MYMEGDDDDAYHALAHASYHSESSARYSADESIEPGHCGVAVPIGICIRVRRVFGLDIAKETFGAMLQIVMRWESDNPLPESDLGVGCDWVPADWQPLWVPDWLIRNVAEVIDSSDRFAICHNPEHGTGRHRRHLIVAEHKRLVNLFQTMDLAHFPFDVQDFKIGIELQGVSGVSECRFVPYSAQRPVALAIRTPGAMSFADMRLHPSLAIIPGKPLKPVPTRFFLTPRERSLRAIPFSVVELELRFERRAEYYLVNVAFVSFLSALLSALGFQAIVSLLRALRFPSTQSSEQSNIGTDSSEPTPPCGVHSNRS